MLLDLKVCLCSHGLCWESLSGPWLSACTPAWSLVGLACCLTSGFDSFFISLMVDGRLGFISNAGQMSVT